LRPTKCLAAMSTCSPTCAGTCPRTWLGPGTMDTSPTYCKSSCRSRLYSSTGLMSWSAPKSICCWDSFALCTRPLQSWLYLHLRYQPQRHTHSTRPIHKDVRSSPCDLHPRSRAARCTPRLPPTSRCTLQTPRTMPLWSISHADATSTGAQMTARLRPDPCRRPTLCSNRQWQLK